MANLGKLKAIMVAPSALPWSCPPPNKAQWDSHPRVFINLTAKQPEQQCPYCSARYALKTPSTNDSTGE